MKTMSIYKSAIFIRLLMYLKKSWILYFEWSSL